MDNYFFSKIALSLLLSGVLGFFIGCWWAWSVFSSWRKRTVQTHADATAALEAQVEEINKKNAEEKSKALEARSEAEAAEAKSRATEARLRSLEETSRIQMHSSDKDLLAVRDMLESVQPKLKLLEQKESEVQTWMTRFDGLAADKDRLIGEIRVELGNVQAERDGIKTRLDEVVTEKDRTIAELMERLAGVSDAARELDEARARQKNLEEQLADHRQTIDTWETHVNSLTSEQTAKLEAANRKFEAASETIASLRAEVEALQTNVADRNDSISRLEADAALLSHLRQSMRERQTRIDGLKLQLEQSRDALQKTLQELVQLKMFAESSRDAQARERDAEISRLNGELEQLKANLFERNEALSRLEADAALLSHVRQSMRERQTRIDGLTLQLAHARKELAEAKAGLVPAGAAPADTGAIEEMAQALSERDRQIQLLEENLMAANAAVVPAADLVPQEELQAAKSEVARLRDELAALEARSATAAAQAQSSLEAELMRLREELNAKDRQLQSLQESQQAAAEQMQAALVDRDERLAAWESRYEATLGELHEEAGRLQSRIRAMESGRGAASRPAVGPVEGSAETVAAVVPAAEAVPAIVPAADEVQARLRLATMRGIQFRPESDEIEPSSTAILDGALEALRGLSTATVVEIAGHTDSWGDDAANQLLSERRALAVQAYLSARGAAAALVSKGYGGSRPIADNLTADGRFANRRIEFLVRG